MQATMKEGDPLSVDQYCDNETGELKGIHPKLILRDQKELLDSKLKASLSSHYHNTEMYHKYEALFGEGWYGKYSDKLHLRIQSPAVHFFTTFEAYKSWCKEHHPQVNSEKCAIDYTFIKRKVDYDQIEGLDLQYAQLNEDGVYTTESMDTQRAFSRYILHFGLLLHFLKVKIDYTVMMALMIALNLIF